MGCDTPGRWGRGYLLLACRLIWVVELSERCSLSAYKPNMICRVIVDS